MQLCASFQPLRIVRVRDVNKANQICESVDGEDIVYNVQYRMIAMKDAMAIT